LQLMLRTFVVPALLYPSTDTVSLQIDPSA
jgi:hypothetical protein